MVAMTLLVVPLVLVGCGTKDTDTDDFVKVSVAESIGFDGFSPDFFIEFDDEDTLADFEEMFENAVKQDGIVDMAEPEYAIEAEFEDGRKLQYYLWVGGADQRSTLMNVDDTQTIYLTSAEETKWLIDLLQ